MGRCRPSLFQGFTYGHGNLTCTARESEQTQFSPGKPEARALLLGPPSGIRDLPVPYFPLSSVSPVFFSSFASFTPEVQQIWRDIKPAEGLQRVAGFSEREGWEATVWDLCKSGQEEPRLWLFFIQFSSSFLLRRGLSKEGCDCLGHFGSPVGAAWDLAGGRIWGLCWANLRGWDWQVGALP